MGGSACTRRSAPDEGLPLAGRKRLHVFYSKNLGVSLEPTLDFVTPSNAFASLLTKTLGVDRSNPCGPLSRNYACVSLGNVATCLLAKTRRRSPTNSPRTPGPSSDLPASGALAAMDNVGPDPRLSSAPRDQKYAKFFRRSQGTSPKFSTERTALARPTGRSRTRVPELPRIQPSPWYNRCLPYKLRPSGYRS
jgi:hypothetical protein